MALTPSTQALLKYLRDDSRVAEIPIEDIPEDDPSVPVHELQVKRRRRKQLLKQMMENAGLPELAKMTSVRTRNVRLSDEEI